MSDKSDNWPFYINSPAASVDSGIGLSPPPQVQDGHEDVPKKGEGVCQQVISREVAIEGDELMKIVARLSSENRETTPANDDPELSKVVDVILELEDRNDSDMSSYSNVDVEPSGDTLETKRTEGGGDTRLRRARPSIERWLQPKTGTSKPRQSHTKRKGKPQGSIITGRITKSQKYRVGARVKMTAREELESKRRWEKLKAAAHDATSPLCSTMPQVTHPNSPFNYDENIGLVSQAVCYRDISGDIVTDAASCVGQAEYCQRMEKVVAEAEQRAILPPPFPQLQAVPMMLQTTQSSTARICEEVMCLGQTGDVLDQALAADGRCVDEVEQYCERVKERDIEETPLHFVVGKLNEKHNAPQRRIPTQSMRNVTEIVCGKLREYINVTNPKGETPIFQAAIYGNEGAVQGLMNYQASPSIKEISGGENAVHAAVKGKNPNVLGTILSKMGERSYALAPIVSEKNYGGHAPLHVAAEFRDLDPNIQGRMILDLINAGADTTAKNDRNRMARCLLPSVLKQDKNFMKQFNEPRKRACAQQRVWENPSPQPEAGIYCDPTACKPQHLSHIFPQMTQPLSTNASTHFYLFPNSPVLENDPAIPNTSGQQLYTDTKPTSFHSIPAPDPQRYLLLPREGTVVDREIYGNNDPPGPQPQLPTHLQPRTPQPYPTNEAACFQSVSYDFELEGDHSSM